MEANIKCVVERGWIYPCALYLHDSYMSTDEVHTCDGTRFNSFELNGGTILHYYLKKNDYRAYWKQMKVTLITVWLDKGK